MSDDNKAAAPDVDPIDRIARVYLLRLYRESLGAGRSLRSWLHDRSPLAFALGLTEQGIARWGAERLSGAVSDCLEEPENAAPAGPLATAVREFGRELGLSGTESEVLLLAVVVAQNDVVSSLGPKQLAGSCRVVNSIVAVAAGIEPRVAREALTPNSRLVRAGLLRPAPILPDDLADYLQLLDGLAEAFLEGRASTLLQEKLTRAPAPTIGMADASYMRDEASAAIALLKGAIDGAARGVQILLHGEPGVGKTELARLIASDTGAAVFNVPDSSEAGEPLAAEKRLRHFALMQRLLPRSGRTILIFDEVDDLLASPDPWGDEAKPAKLKAWKNRLLEETEVPSIWIGNSLVDVDPALLRRFTLVIRVPAPSVQARRVMLDRQASEYLGDAGARAMVAEREDITPADIARACRATELARPNMQEPTGEYFLRSLGLRAGRAGPRLRIRAPAPALPYRIEWLNTDPKIDDVVRLLKARGGGRLCFFGPPGTGKTALAQHLARALDRPLHSKKASDLLSAWLGETEQNLARAFEGAERDGAVLLLDEADSFLRGREHAVRSWEVSQVNQLLKELEAFDGVVALCTNSFEMLDAAVLRRLDLKVRFDRLGSGAAREAFLEAAASMGIAAVEAESVVLSQPVTDGEFALGDIAVALRQARLRAGTPSAALLRQCLEAELMARRDRDGRPIGFTR